MGSVRFFALSAIAWLVAGPAAASPCLDLIEELEAVLEQADLDRGQEDVAVSTRDGPVDVTTPEGGATPQENWFGDPATSEAAAEGLSDARAMADQGEEEDCLARVREVEAIVGR